MIRYDLMVCSVLHIPVDEREEIEDLIRQAERDPDTGRLIVKHPHLTIAPCDTGFGVYTRDLEKQDVRYLISPIFWSVLEFGVLRKSPWILFDNDMDPDPDIDIY